MADYTKLDVKDINDILGSYDLGRAEKAVPLSGGQANSSYRLNLSKGNFTLCVCDEKTPDEVEVLTRVLDYIDAGGFPSTRAVHTAEGSSFIIHDGKPVYIKEFLPGKVVRDLDRSMLEQVGDAMAKLHELEPPAGLPQAFPYGLGHFDEVLDSQGLSHPFKDWLAEKETWLKGELDPAMARGFIHGDIFWDNLLFDKGRLSAVLDFEEASLYYLLYDLGMAAVGCCSARGQFDRDKIDGMLRGYQNRRPLSRREREQFIPFLVYAATAAAFWRFRQYNLRHPDPDLADYYEELAALADQAGDLKIPAIP
ncbi:MAG: homoserine kinase [Desulfobacter sp.]|nr:MAG: homoserine kinase [Desulfobacter sp.]